ncbi:MAG: T9SS type A sorting domain-containing protein [Bacteroidetes bacterium]|nr:T9SS type A sorting domain-containing protein [Bacteroidota bacterium]
MKMNYLPRIMIFVLVQLCLTNNMRAQQDFLNDFTITNNNGVVLMKWVIASGVTCDGVRVFRSSDDIFYEQIGRIEGICGSPYSAVSYVFNDSLPQMNQVNYYKLELGNIGFSPVRALLIIDFSEQNFQIIPNPAKEYCNIHFQNAMSQLHSMQLFDLSGKLFLELQTNESSFYLNTSELKPQIYVFRIINNANRSFVSGRIAVKP